MLRTCPEIARRLSDHEVARRWLTITTLAKGKSDAVPVPDPRRVEELVKDMPESRVSAPRVCSPCLEHWGKLIGDVPAATAIFDRFLHHAELIRITGKSYRLTKRSTMTLQKLGRDGFDEMGSFHLAAGKDVGLIR